MGSQFNGQTVLGASADLYEDIVGPVEHLFESNCVHVTRPYEFSEADGVDNVGDAKRALLQFMIAATPKSEVVQDILSRYDEHLASMTSMMQTSLVGDHNIMEEIIDNVPDAVNPVKAKLAYVQVPKGGKTVLNLVWKVRASFSPYDASLIFFGSSKSRCKITGTKHPFPPPLPTGSSLSSIGLLTRPCPSRRSLRPMDQRPTTFSSGVSMTPLKVTAPSRRRIGMLSLALWGGTPSHGRMTPNSTVCGRLSRSSGRIQRLLLVTT